MIGRIEFYRSRARQSRPAKSESAVLLTRRVQWGTVMYEPTTPAGALRPAEIGRALKDATPTEISGIFATVPSKTLDLIAFYAAATIAERDLVKGALSRETLSAYGVAA